MEDFIGKVKEQAVWAKDEATKLGKQVYEKTNTVISKTKISFAISETDSKIKDIYAEIGKLAYERFQAGEEICDFAKESCEKLNELFKEKAELTEKLSELKDSVKCAECGKNNDADAEYCSKCGSKLSKMKKHGDIEFDSEPIAVYSEDMDDETSEEEDTIELKQTKKVITVEPRS